MKKKALAFALVLCMVIAMLPVSVFAATIKQTARIEALPLNENQTQLPVEPQALPELPAEPNAGKYKITAKVTKGSSHGEIELSASSANAGEAVYLLANPDNGYLVEFGGGYDYTHYEMELGYLGLDIYEITMPDGDVSLEVKFVAAPGSNHSVNVSKNVNGGTITASRSKAKEGESVVLEVKVKDGYYLEGLYAEDSNGNGVVGGYLGQDDDGTEIFEVIMPATKLYVEAVFEKVKPHNITISPCTGGTATVNKSQLYAGEEFILTCIPDAGRRVNYIDCRMYPDVVPLTQISATQWKGIMPDGDVHIDVTFQYLERSVTVNVTNPEGGTATVDRPSALPYTTVKLTCNPNENYRVVSVTGVAGLKDQGNNIWSFTMPEQDVALRVTFKTIYNPVTVTVETGLGGSAIPNVLEAKAGDTVTLTVSPEEGYRIARITGVKDLTDNGDGTYTFTMPDNAVDIKVLFLRHENPFLDVNETHFFYTPVLWAVENGITSGISADAFGPMSVCNRAQVVTFLWRYAGSPEPTTTEHPFTDVPAGSFYEKAVLWALENGITTGVSATEFGPGLACNRAQVVTFLWRLMKQPAPATTEHPFTDVAAGSFYESPVLWALENGITTGATATTFNPNGECLRAQVVTFLYRTAQLPPPPVFYALETVFDAQMGTVTLSHTEAQAGETVTVTAQPNEGYLLESVTCASGAELTQVSETEFTFVMGEAAETVTVTFAPVPTEPEEPTEPTEPEPEEPTDPQPTPKTYELVLKDNGHGTVSYVDATSAAPGQSIFFHAVPEEGYFLERVGIFNPDNAIDVSQIRLYEHEDHLYELVMINHDIIMTLYFSPIPG
ncbi:MAG: S-layer homology domain-containing protein [Oscillospiraceae bacterium]|nr:S-layer homology domain-containing protein [Oscillospiraceae bacterium]